MPEQPGQLQLLLPPGLQLPAGHGDLRRYRVPRTHTGVHTDTPVLSPHRHTHIPALMHSVPCVHTCTLRHMHAVCAHTVHVTCTHTPYTLHVLCTARADTCACCMWCVYSFTHTFTLTDIDLFTLGLTRLCTLTSVCAQTHIYPHSHTHLFLHFTHSYSQPHTVTHLLMHSDLQPFTRVCIRSDTQLHILVLTQYTHTPPYSHSRTCLHGHTHSGAHPQRTVCAHILTFSYLSSQPHT